MKARDPLSSLDPGGGPVVTPRAVVALLLVLGGIAWIVYYYTGVRADPGAFDPKSASRSPLRPGFIGDLEKWNYVIGFGPSSSAWSSPRTPRPRSAAAAASWSGCSAASSSACCGSAPTTSSATTSADVPVMNDLGQYNLVVGIGFMAVGFTYATRWE